MLSRQEAFDWLADFSRLCFRRIAEQRPEATIILEKTPNHGRCGADIIRLFPESYFIHVIRDPRAVVASLRAASMSWGADWAPGRVEDACNYWNDYLEKCQEIATLTPRYTEVFYDHLHSDGANEMVRLFHWLGEPIEPRQAELCVDACTFDKLNPGSLTPVRKKKADKKFFRRGETESWRSDLSPSDIAIVERSTKKQMKRLGYEPVSDGRARMIASLRLRAYRTANAFALGARSLADRVKP